jgi:hypothetical protein
MEAGLSFWLAILPGIILADMFNLSAIISQISVLLFVIGSVFFFFGLIGRQELAERKQTGQDNPTDCSKS